MPAPTAAVAAGISGIFGLLGFAVYAVLRISSKKKDPLRLTPELVNALKNHGITPDVLAGFTPEQAGEYLKQQGHLSAVLIDRVMRPDITAEHRTVLVVSISLVVLAVVLGLFLGPSDASQLKPKSTDKNEGETSSTVPAAPRVAAPRVDTVSRPAVKVTGGQRGQPSVQTIDVVREGSTEPIPGVTCAGNPAQPPRMECVAFLSGFGAKQNLLFNVPPDAFGSTIVKATLELRGLSDPSGGPKCIAISVDGTPLGTPTSLTLNHLQADGRLYEATNMSTVTIEIPGRAYPVFRSVGRHMISIEVPDSCASTTGFVAFRDGRLQVARQ